MARKNLLVPEAATVPSPPEQEQFYDYGYFRSRQKLTELQVLLLAYLNHEGLKKNKPDFPRKAWFFKQIALKCWGPENKAKQFVWHPWADKMNEVAHEHPVTGAPHPHVAFNGAASTGKTDYCAIFAIINWICDTVGTLVLVTSTSILESRKRIWGAITSYFMAVPGLPGKLVDSRSMIVTVDDHGNKLTDRSGIAVVAGEKKKEKEAIGKLIGAKNKRVILVADELPELTEAIQEAAMSNLVSNPFFQMLAAGNFKSRYDAFGVFCRPKRGYDSITINDTEWETELGYCVRFDGLKSPNVLEGKDIWPMIYGLKQLKAHQNDLGENSASFWRMCRSFEPPIGLDNAIYSESDLIAGNAYGSVIWEGIPTPVSGLDLGFTNGGDRSVQWFGKWGMSIEGINVLLVEKMLLLREDVGKKIETRNYQIANQFIANCKTYGVSPEHAGLDATAAGAVFADIVCEKWSPKVLRVDFSGAPSDLQINFSSDKTAKTAYDRKVTELWYVGLEFVKSKQIRGVTQELARELKARQYDTVKGAEGLKMRAEPKDAMKERLGFSPDIADAFVILLHVCRERLGALAGGQNGGMVVAGERWKERHRALQEMYAETNLYQPEAA